MVYHLLPFSTLHNIIKIEQYTPLPEGYASIGELIKEYRVKNNLTYIEMSKLLDVFTVQVKNWELGKNKPTINFHNSVIKIFYSEI